MPATIQVKKTTTAIEALDANASATSDLRKAVEAIAIRPQAGKLTLLTRKINNVLLAEAQRQGIDEPSYRIPLSKLCAKADYDSTNMSLVKDQLRKMASTIVEWNVGVKGSRRWGISSLISVEVIEDGNRCTIEWSYPTQLKAKLLAPDIYARLSLQMQNTFRSSAALALYEICVRYVDSPGQLTMRLNWEVWRPILTGVPDPKEDEEGERTYNLFKYFKRDVLKPAVAEVNKLTDVEVALIEHKVGRSVAELQFSVKPKGQAGLPLDEPNLFDLNLITRIVALGFTQAQAEKIYSDTADEAQLRSVLVHTEKRLKQMPPIENPQGYFRHALQAGYVSKTAARAAPAKALEDKSKKAAKKPASGTQLTQQLAEHWLTAKRAEAREDFEALSQADQADELAKFAASGKLPSMLRKKWETVGLKDKMCAASFLQWLIRDVKEPSELELLQYGLANGLIAAATS